MSIELREPGEGAPGMRAAAPRICSRCVMDTSAVEIEFDDQGVCNFCSAFEQKAARYLYRPDVDDRRLAEIVDAMKREGRRKEYDCVLGVSGGVDSSYLAYRAHELGLRVLAVHFDNGWDSELAVANVERIVKKLGLGYQTYVVDWEEFRRIQLSFLRASIPNVEIPTDHALMATLYRTATEVGTRYLLTGSNFATEGILPRSWAYNPKDLRHLKSIHRRFGDGRFDSFPQLGYLRELSYTYGRRIRRIRLLHHMPYVKTEALATLEQELDWVYYGGKHYESVFTRFFQAYILPYKFGIDKRRAHLSTLICSGQLGREQALAELEAPLYGREQLREDREYVLKKLGLSEDEFEGIMHEPPRRSEEYGNASRLIDLAYDVYGHIRR
jgi:N-acetyl sugar amidotransferase